MDVVDKLLGLVGVLFKHLNAGLRESIHGERINGSGHLSYDIALYTAGFQHLFDELCFIGSRRAEDGDKFLLAEAAVKGINLTLIGKWIHDLESENRLDGDLFMFSMALQL